MSSDLRDLYQEMILDHGKRPRNFRALAKANRRAEGYNPLCGDRETVYLEVEGDQVSRSDHRRDEGRGRRTASRQARGLLGRARVSGADQVRDLALAHDALGAPRRRRGDLDRRRGGGIAQRRAEAGDASGESLLREKP
jgi:hypothetical protein